MSLSRPGEKIWTIVGRENEHWIDPDSNYCSCLWILFWQTARKKRRAIIWNLQHLAISDESFEKIVFSDEEFSDFLSGLIADL